MNCKELSLSDGRDAGNTAIASDSGNSPRATRVVGGLFPFFFF